MTVKYDAIGSDNEEDVLTPTPKEVESEVKGDVKGEDVIATNASVEIGESEVLEASNEVISPKKKSSKRKNRPASLQRDPPGNISSRMVLNSGPLLQAPVISVNNRAPPAAAAANRKTSLTRRKSSMLAASDDPFAFREGKTLMWRNVNMILVSEEVSMF